MALTSKRLCNTLVEEIILIIIIIVRKYVSVVLLHVLKQGVREPLKNIAHLCFNHLSARLCGQENSYGSSIKLNI